MVKHPFVLCAVNKSAHTDDKASPPGCDNLIRPLNTANRPYSALPPIASTARAVPQTAQHLHHTMPQPSSLPSLAPGEVDWSECLDGPAVVAFWGADTPEHAFRLGTREYDWHSHLRGQLFYIDSGLAHIRTPQGSWLLPAHRAGWIPPGVQHKASISGALSGWGVLLTPEAARLLPERACVMGVSELLRALVRRATGWPLQMQLTPERQRLLAVLLDEIRLAPHEPLHLPMPQDRRLLRIAQALLATPGDTRTLGQWALQVGLSERSARRLFSSETGLSFAHWRQQARLTLALEQLANGQAVADVAHDLGYASASNFIAMFRRAFGQSPGRYFAKT